MKHYRSPSSALLLLLLGYWLIVIKRKHVSLSIALTFACPFPDINHPLTKTKYLPSPSLKVNLIDHIAQSISWTKTILNIYFSQGKVV